MKMSDTDVCFSDTFVVSCGLIDNPDNRLFLLYSLPEFDFPLLVVHRCHYVGFLLEYA
jgi:hypothetical protein